ncbi:MAG: Nif3-like dinuclear metal center hexameric protein [Chitinophagaceae bacterium]
MNSSDNHFTSRRNFVGVITKSMGFSVLLAPSGIDLLSNGLWKVQRAFTVGEVIDLFLKEIPGAPFEKTVDTLKSGSKSQQVTGIVTTMFATVEIIRKAIERKANFIIAHEPTFYNHQDETSWLEKDEVYRYKADLLQKHNIAVWRCHDYIHSHRPDGVRAGVVKALGWEKYVDADNPALITIPAIPLKDLITHAKGRLGISNLRYAGDLSLFCHRILLMPGASGGRSQIEATGKVKPDLLMCGELSEWETAEYIRDARLKSQKIALVILGHAASEEPGLEWMASWLKKALPGMRIEHIASQNPLSFI